MSAPAPSPSRSTWAPWSRWSPVRSALATVAGVRGGADRVWAARYLLGRRLPAVAPPDGERRLRFHGLGAPITLDSGSGGMSTYYEIVRAGVYRDQPGAVPPPGGCVVDVGANLGVFAAWAADRVGPTGVVVAVEPHPHAYDLLTRNLAEVPATVVTVPAACGREDATLPLRYVPGRLAVATLGDDAPPGASATVEVAVRRLDDILAQEGVGRVDLLKVDVEGFEAEVLDGAPRTLARTDRVVLEVARADRHGVHRRLEAAGFAVRDGATGVWGDAGMLVVHGLRRADG